MYLISKKFFGHNGATLACYAIFAAMCLAGLQASAAFSVNPAKGATGVGTSTPVVFTFDAPMDPDMTDAMFLDMANPIGGTYETENTWNPAGTVLTCTPLPSWPANKQITWFLSGEEINPLEAMGSFTTGSSSTGGGTNAPSGTNRITDFVVGKLHYYEQYSSGAPVLDATNMPYAFMAISSLASNRTATAIEVKAPTGVTYNLNTFALPEYWQYFDFEQTNLTAFDAAYPGGNYVFKLTSSSGSDSYTVNLPANMQQPNAPRITNFDALKNVDATKALTLSWEPFQGATAKDYISVSVGTNFNTPDYLETNALPGTATSVTIPANTLVPGEEHYGSVMFIRQSYVTNTVVATGAYRATITEFTVTTSGGGSTGENLPVTNVKFTGGKFGFQFSTTPGSTYTVESSATLQPGSWTVVLTTNAIGSSVQFVEQRNINGPMFYRVR